MTKEDKQAMYEKFKSEVLEWRNAHLLECKEFEHRMYDNDGAELANVFCGVLTDIPSLLNHWKALWLSNTDAELELFDRSLDKMSIAKKLVDDFRSDDKKVSAGHILSWLWYGNFYEAVVLLNEKFAKDKKHLNWFERKICLFTAKSAISSSIKLGLRTKEQWLTFNKEKELLDSEKPLELILADILDDKEAETAESVNNPTISKNNETPQQQSMLYKIQATT